MSSRLTRRALGLYPLRRSLVALHLAWQGLFFGVPLLLLLSTSLHRYDLGRPQEGLTLVNYRTLLLESPFPAALLRSLFLGSLTALLVTALALVTVLAAWQVGGARARRALLLGCAIIFFAGVIPRTYAFEFFLSAHGPLGPLWRAVVPGEGASLLYSAPGVVIAYFPVLLPLSVAALYVARRDVPEEYLDAARDVGAGWLTTQARVVVPLMRPGLVVSLVLAFLLAAGDVVVVDLIGGSQVYTAASQVLDYVKVDDWGTAASASVLLLAACGLVLAGGTALLPRGADS